MAQKSPANTKQFTRYKILGTFGLIIVFLSVGYFIAYRPLIIKHDKDNFLKAQANIEGLFTQIEAKIGKPDQVKRNQSCARANIKNSQGSLLCDVDIYGLYENKDSTQSNDLVSKVSVLSTAPLRVGSGNTMGKTFTPQTDRSLSQVFYQDYKNIASLSCTISYRYPANEGHPGSFQSQYTEKLQIGIGCGGSAKAEHFPIKN